MSNGELLVLLVGVVPESVAVLPLLVATTRLLLVSEMFMVFVTEE